MARKVKMIEDWWRRDQKYDGDRVPCHCTVIMICDLPAYARMGIEHLQFSTRLRIASMRLPQEFETTLVTKEHADLYCQQEEESGPAPTTKCRARQEVDEQDTLLHSRPRHWTRSATDEYGGCDSLHSQTATQQGADYNQPRISSRGLREDVL